MAASGGSWKRGAFTPTGGSRTGGDVSRSATSVATRLGIKADPQGKSSQSELEIAAKWINRQKGLRAVVTDFGVKVGNRGEDERRGTSYGNAYHAISAVMRDDWSL